MAVSQTQATLERLLFETGAIRVAPADKAFWYTSGTIGPYYSNTQNLIGGGAIADELLGLIDSWLSGDAAVLPAKIAEFVFGIYEKNECFRTVADLIKECACENIDMARVDFVSGGARRDWFFSFIAAKLLGKPHISIFKDLSMAAGGPYAGPPPYPAAAPVRAGALAGASCLHVSDIITEASSYVRAWSPAIAASGARIAASVTVLDRLQGGGAALASIGIRHFALAALDAGFFDRAHRNGYIDERQRARLLRYAADPNGAMREFLKENPRFFADALAGGGKDAERARMCAESGVYGDAM